MGGHGYELAGDLQVHAPHLGQVVQILLQQRGDADILDLYPVAAEKLQDQLQGAVKVHVFTFAPDHSVQVKAQLVQGDTTFESIVDS